MKRIKIIKAFCLLFVAVSSIVFMASMTAFAAHTDGNTEVVAHIENCTIETTQTVTDNANASVTDDENNISTGDMIFVSAAISFILLLISLFVLIICNKCNAHTEIRRNNINTKP